MLSKFLEGMDKIYSLDNDVVADEDIVVDENINLSAIIDKQKFHFTLKFQLK